MKKLIFAVFIAIAALIFSGCPADVAGTTLDDTVLDQSQEDNLDAAIGADSITLDNITLDTDGVAEFRVDQPEDIIVTMTFNGVIIDEDTVATGIIFYNLGDTADTDGAYHREEVLEYESVVVEFDQWADATDVIFTFNIPDGTDTGSLIEYFIDPTVLTGNNGLARMDYDGDQVPAEAQDDDYIGYITVADAGYTADGASRQPRGIFPIAVGTDIILDTDQIDISVASIFAPVTVLTTLAELDETIDLELFDPVTGTWSVINASTTLDNVNGIYTLEIPVDADAGQIYRYILHDPYDLQESATVRGYRHRLSYDQNQEWEWRNLGGGIVDSVPGDYDNWQTPGTVDWSGVVQSVNDTQVRVVLTATGVGTEGLDLTSITQDSLRLWDDDDNYWVPWETAELGDTDNVVILYLNPSYKIKGNDVDLYIGPAVKDLGDTTAATDDVLLGDYSNYDDPPYGFSFDDIGGSGDI